MKTMVSIADCGKWVSGGTPRKSDPRFWNGQIPWISAKSLKTFELSDSQDRVTELGAREVTLVPAGTILFVVRGMSLAKEFRVGITTREVTFNQDLRGIIPGDDVDARYLTRILHAAAAHILGRVTNAGHGTKRLPTDDLKNIKIPLPSLSEQRRIAEILDAADAIRRKRQQAIALTEQFLRSTFLDMFGDPVTNPKGWPQFTFDDRLTMVQYGPRFFNEAYTKNGVRIVRISDLDFDGNLNYETMPIFDADEDARKDFCLHPGDLLLARTGATVGKTALIEADAPPSIAGAYFIRLRFQADILPLYAQMILRSKSMQAIIAQKSKQSAQPNFNGPGIRRLPMPLPPLALQQKFEQVHQQATCTLRKRKRDAVTTDNLFNSLVQRAFRGEL